MRPWSARLFRLRAADLLDGADASSARGTLSGLLLGAELAAARPYWLGQEIALIGAPKLNLVYANALKTQGVSASSFDSEPMTIAGLSAVHKELIHDIA